MAPTLKRRIMLASTLVVLGSAIWITYRHDKITPAVAESSITNTVYVASDQNQTATARLLEIMKAPHSLEQAKLAAISAITERQHELDNIQGNVTSNASLEASIKSQLSNNIDTMKNGLNTLARNISDTTKDDENFRLLTKNITEGFPVFSILLPQTQGLEIIAANTTILATGAKTGVELQNIATRAKANGVDTTEFENNIHSYLADLQAISSSLSKAKSLLLSIDMNNLPDAQGKRDAAINELRNTNNKINEASAYVSQILTPTANNFNR